MLINTNPPKIMHIDLNSCFASIEQQAYPRLRGKPIAIAAYPTPGGCILAPSIEAKKLGIKVGMRVREARLIFPNLIVRDPDPEMVRSVHQKFMGIFSGYSPDVTPKSIDEAVIDFSRAPESTVSLEEAGHQIKKRVRKEIGDWISCNIGIATNRFLAKLAASLHKPDGLDIITHKNLLKIYEKLTLTDFCGINTRYEARLNQNGVFTPLQFFEASEHFLQKYVFKSIVGVHWYFRLRGWEVDNVNYPRKSFGHEYALGEKTADREKLRRIILKLCEKTGRRLRRSDLQAQGIHLAILFADYDFWHKGIKLKTPVFTTMDIFKNMMMLFALIPVKKTVAKISLSCHYLEKLGSRQGQLFENNFDKEMKISQALDKINDRFGEFTITPAIMMNMNDIVLDRIAFGGKNLLS